MAELLTSNFIFLSFILILQIEFFYFLCYEYCIFFSKTFKISSTVKNYENKTFFNYNSLVLVLMFLISLFSKYNFFKNSLFFIFFLFSLAFLNYSLKCFYLFQKNSKTQIQLVISLFFGFFLTIQLVKDFFTFFFFIEIYGVMYFFFFLTSYNLTNFTILKYKNSILLLLWNNFLTTIFLSVSCFFLLKSYGTTNFTELATLNSTPTILGLFLIGLAWKLGIPFFHFFKLEIYKFLTRENIFFFSVITSLVNILIFYFSIQIPVIYTLLYLNNWLFVFIFFLINLVIYNLNIQSVLVFFALSSLITVATVLVLLIS